MSDESPTENFQNQISKMIDASIPRPWMVGVLFLALKLTGIIEWHWMFVTMPFYLIPALCIGVYIASFAIYLFLILVALPFSIYKNLREKRISTESGEGVESKSNQQEFDGRDDFPDKVKEEVNAHRRLREGIAKAPRDEAS